MALMNWWGLTIDTVSCINLVLCVGLCVDYSAHIGLHFLQVGLLLYIIKRSDSKNIFKCAIDMLRKKHYSVH